MDVFEKVQQTRPEIEGAEENLAAARALLLMEIQEERAPARPRAARRPWFIAAGALGAAAAVTAGVLVLSNVTAPTPAPTVEAIPTRVPGPVLVPSPVPSPTATPMTGPEALLGAANSAAGFAPPVLAPGQYLRRAWTEDLLWTYEPSLDELGMSPGEGGSRATATSAWVIRRSGADYSPADLRTQWYREWGPAEVTDIFGDEAEARTQLEIVLQRYGPGQSLVPEVPWLPESGAENFLWYFDVMPRDPQAMVSWIHDYLGADAQGWADGKVGWMLIGLLSFNVGDPEMRAAMYRALSLLPGSTVSDEQDGKRTVTFDSHLASADSSQLSLWRYTLTIEMATGIVTEITNTADVGRGMVPGDIPNSRTTYSMSVVDTLP